MANSQTKNIVPRVSVAAGIYNCAATLGEAIRSIQAQTYTDWELILCDDGSTDDTVAVAESYAAQDTRIRVVRNPRNLGLNHSLNHCLREARGEFYARMDGDDTCEPDRLAKLVEALDTHPEMAMVSSWMTCFDADGTWGLIRTKANPVDRDFLRGTPFVHAACMMRTNALRALNGYGTEPWLRRAEDLDLWFRLYAGGSKGFSIQEPLYHMRDDRAARRRRTFGSRLDEARVLWRGFSMLKLPLYLRFWALRPILVGLVPSVIYEIIRRRRHQAKDYSHSRASE